MYKRFSLEELSTIQNNFIPHLYKYIQQERCQGVNDFFKFAFREGNEVFYFERGNVAFKVALENNTFSLTDEVDKIQVQIPADHKWGLNDLVKKFVIKKQRQIWQKSIEQILMEAFKSGGFSHILGKKYLVYDIETSMIGDRLEDTEFYIGYSMEELNDGSMHYECILKENLNEFVEKMLTFDGYIVGFNQIWFDNPVSVYNAGGSQTDIDALNAKSIDLYVFIQQMTKKRIGLNKLSEALIGISKTLESGADVETMRNQRKQTGEEDILNEIKKYCKNDVRMTALLFMYFLYFKKIYIDEQEYLYDIPTFIEYANLREKSLNQETLQTQSLL